MKYELWITLFFTYFALINLFGLANNPATFGWEIMEYGYNSVYLILNPILIICAMLGFMLAVSALLASVTTFTIMAILKKRKAI